MGVKDTGDFLSGPLIEMDIVFAEEGGKREAGEVWKGGPEAKLGNGEIFVHT